jgi:hypothetical protein
MESLFIKILFMHVKNYLLPILLLGAACKSGPSDQELATSINSSLSSSTGRINASVDKGVATLTGNAPTMPAKQMQRQVQNLRRALPGN